MASTCRSSTAPIVGGGEWVALVVFHDMTEARRVEQTRRDFVANVSHELRTPLASIKSVIETLQSGALDDQAAAQDFLSRADAEVDRLVQMVEELLELSRLESGQVPLAKEPVDMGDVLGRAVERLRPQAEKKGLSLTLEVAPDLPPVIGDAERLERAAVNLLHNAIKFTPDGGSVRVSATFGGRRRHGRGERHRRRHRRRGPAAHLRTLLQGRPRPRQRTAAPAWAWRSSSTPSRPTAAPSAWRASRATAPPSLSMLPRLLTSPDSPRTLPNFYLTFHSPR